MQQARERMHGRWAGGPKATATLLPPELQQWLRLKQSARLGRL
jgi:hypothetical protein